MTGHNRATVVTSGSPQQFWKLFERDMALSASSFFVAPQSEVEVHLKHLAAVRKISMQDPLYFSHALLSPLKCPSKNDTWLCNKNPDPSGSVSIDFHNLFASSSDMRRFFW